MPPRHPHFPARFCHHIRFKACLLNQFHFSGAPAKCLKPQDPGHHTSRYRHCSSFSSGLHFHTCPECRLWNSVTKDCIMRPISFLLFQIGFPFDHCVAIVHNAYCFLLNLLFHYPSSGDQKFHIMDIGGWEIECLHIHEISWGSIPSMKFICFIHTWYT